MKTTHDLSQINWTLSGCTPFQWQLNPFKNVHQIPALETGPIPAKVPGSVQAALLDARLIPDWNQGLNAPLCEWVENRHWLYQAVIPSEWLKPGNKHRLICQGLDGQGWILINGQIISQFDNSFLPYTFDITPYIQPGDVLLQIIFDLSPRWLGQFGYTSQMTKWKTRFNYTWDWVSRIVQIGIWDNLSLEVSDGPELEDLTVYTNYSLHTKKGGVSINVAVNQSANLKIQLFLEKDNQIIKQEEYQFGKKNQASITWNDLNISPWWCNGLGSQTLYQLTCILFDEHNQEVDRAGKTVGFKSIEWLPCQDAPEGADSWICVVNGKPVFLQGFNWTPILPNFADVTEEDYRKRLLLYKDMGVNILRVWGGAFLEKEIFYNLCDKLGILVWQEFPLSSSGIDNWPPEDPASIEVLTSIARSYIHRRKHHVSLLCWCGGNELQGDLSGHKTGVGKPVDINHPLIKIFSEIVEKEDPERRFLATSSSGPLFYADPKDFGKGLHWDVHGPWKLPASMEEWSDYWEKVDALFHSEVGAPGCSPADVIAAYNGSLPLMPASVENPLWRRTSWWIEWPEFVDEKGFEPGTLDEFITWSQERQAKALTIVAQSLKDKFPRCGGVIFWMGHDCFPCTANTSVIDFHGNPKPAALALRSIFLNSKDFSESI